MIAATSDISRPVGAIEHGTPGCARIWLIALAAALILYVATASHSVQWQDSGVQQLRIVTGEIDNPHGLALTHPVQYWLGRLMVGVTSFRPAFAITLVSSVAAAIAMANLAATIWLLTRNRLATVIATVALALSHTNWQHATHTESYTLLAMFLTGEWLFLAKFAKTGKARYLLATALLSGLGLGTHMMASLTIPVTAVVFLWAARTQRCSWATVAAGAMLWLLGSAPYTGLVALRIHQTGDALGVIHSAVFGEYAGDVLNLHMTVRDALLPLGYAAYNLPGLTIPLAICGVFTAFSKRTEPRWLMLVYFADLLIFTVFVYRYSVQDQYTFFIPVYLLLGIFCGIGLARLTHSGKRWSRAVVILAAITAVWTPLVYVGTAAVLRSNGVLKSMVGNKPYRDGYRSFFVPWGVCDEHGDQLNDAVRHLAGGNGLVLLPYNMIGVGVRFEQAIGGIPSTVTLRAAPPAKGDDDVVELLSEVRAARNAGRPVVLVPADRDDPHSPFPGLHWKRNGDLYVLVGIDPPPTSGPAHQAADDFD